VVVVFGCGPVGQFAIASSFLMGAGRVFAVDTIASRLEMARKQGAEVIDFNAEDPVQVIRELTAGIGADRAIDAVGVDAVHPGKGPAHDRAKEKEFKKVVEEIAPKTNPQGRNWWPGQGPSQVLEWAVQSLAKAGGLSVIGVYPEQMHTFPLGTAVNKNITLKMGNCNHRRYIPKLVQLVRTGAIDPSEILTQKEPLTAAVEAYKSFDRREPGWVKVKLDFAA
jgi:threonine dehydrogenase-like Zn-dependent dehydrogenase